MAAGDHIFVKRMMGAYTHHGIDIGNKEVVHFTGVPAQKVNAKIEKVSIEEFLRGGRLQIFRYEYLLNELQRGNQSIRTMLFEKVLHDKYDLTDDLTKEKMIKSLISRINDQNFTVRTALNHVGEKGYNIFFNNCEHFAVYCKTGIKFSEQSELLLLFSKADTSFFRPDVFFKNSFNK